MVNVIIDNTPVSVPEKTTILRAAAIAGIPIPTLCYLKDLNEIGACRVCVVEIKGMSRLVSSCNTEVCEGMEIFTNSPKVRAVRRTNAELILSQHDCHCATCARSGNCALQDLGNSLGVLDMPYPRKLAPNRWDMSFPLIRDEEKCVKCMRCVNLCDKIQSLGVWDVINTGSRTNVGVSGSGDIKSSRCSLCGQCITHCPTAALRARDDTSRAFAALGDHDKITIVQIAPAVRAAWGESFGLSREFATVKRLVAAMRKMGFNYIFDTDFSADLTIMEEGSELLDRITNNGVMPMFTSCCPGWIRFIKSEYPDMTPNLSSAKSPQQMFGAVAKSYYAELLGVSPEKIFCVSVMPCTAKKYECSVPTLNDACGQPDVDLVLTTREIDRMIRAEHIVPEALDEEEFDSPLGVSTGAGVIFGATGGVMEAALRSAHFLATGKNPKPDAFSDVRGMQGWKESTFTIGKTKLRVAIASGLGNARKLIEAVRAGKAKYDFIEIMACPGGCSGGGGQPICDGKELAPERASTLYSLDKNSVLRFSHENPSVQELYKNYMERPLSHRAHELLHTEHDKW